MAAPVVIVGGGLSGLCAAYRLAQCNIPFVLLEARDRLGGRILGTPTMALDLGPSWFWPGQRQIALLIEELGLQHCVFAQASEGLSVMEYSDGTLQKSPGGASMAGSNRMDGGLQRLVDALVDNLSASCLRTTAIVQHLEQTSEGVTVTFLQTGASHDMQARHVILALPPRVVAHSLTFDPGLPSNNQQRLTQIPTWMAGQAKFVAQYPEAFWQAQGMSGDAFSQLGPLAEIHDASCRTGAGHALFGFIGVPADKRKGQDEALKAAAVEQLVRLFGEVASQPTAVHLKDWAFDKFTATALDREPAMIQVHRRPSLSSEWENRLVWAGTETAGLTDHSNGYLEGAVETGNRAAELIRKLL